MPNLMADCGSCGGGNDRVYVRESVDAVNYMFMMSRA